MYAELFILRLSENQKKKKKMPLEIPIYEMTESICHYAMHYRERERERVL